jgi:hypothetical protein
MIPSSNEWTSAMADLVWGPRSASGSYNPRRLALQPRAAADMLPIIRACVTMPYWARRPVDGRLFRISLFTEEGGLRQWLIPARRPQGPRATD